MATDRSPYVCIGDSLLDEPWPYDVKSMLVMLSCHMHARWRSDRRLSLEEVARRHPVSKSDLEKITGKRRADVALTSLERLADVASMSVERIGDVTWISWPKWAEYNGTHSRSPGADRAGKPPVMSPSSSASLVPRPRKKKSKSAARENGAARRPKTDVPEELDPPDFDRVRKHFDLVSPGCVALDLDARVESALRYYSREGRRFVNWASAVIDNITLLENSRRDRTDEAHLPSVAEARATAKRREAERAAQQQPELQ